MIKEESCIGCQACVEFCPVHAIHFERDIWGEGKISINRDQCIECGYCERICPGVRAEVNAAPASVYAAVSNNHRNSGSSGGVFYEIAERFINNGGIVYGAAFNDRLKLLHMRAAAASELPALCKSKYLHSDMRGVYKAIRDDLQANRKVLFVGSPCQASAVKNLFLPRYENRLYIVDFLCHGTGTQRVFDVCVHEEEKKRNGKIFSFTFRAKTRKAEHSFSYMLDRNGKKKNVSGFAFEFPYYYSFLKYNIFNDACYSCSYARNDRVGDITLGDFWGIQRYNSKLLDRQGVSMLSVNSEKGKRLLALLGDSCTMYEYPLVYATQHNQAYNIPEPYPDEKLRLVAILSEKGETALAEALSCPNVRKNLLWARMPPFLRKIYKKLRGSNENS